MALMRTANPVLRADTFSESGEGNMTIQGAVQKTAILLLLLVAASCWTWRQAGVDPAGALRWLMLGTLGGFVFALVTIFKKKWASTTAPVYAVLEGLALGGLSAFFEVKYPGIVIQAVALTFGTLAALLAAYASRLIQVTQNFRLGVVAATGGICILYLVDLAMGFFGHRIPMIHESGMVGILFSLFVVTIAALNLVLDFDFIEQGAQSGQPKYMEWYAGFGLMVTLIWLYLEILRLLAKSRDRK